MAIQGAGSAAQPALNDTALRIARDDADGNLIGYIHLDANSRHPVAWSELAPTGEIARWGWLQPGTQEPILDPHGNPISFDIARQSTGRQPRHSWVKFVAIIGAVAVVAVLAAMLLSATAGTGAGTGGDAASAPVTPSTLNLAVSGPTVEGESFDFASLEGKDALIYFYAPWCPYCEQAGPRLKAVADKYGDQIEFVTVSGETNADAPVQGYLDQHDLGTLTNVDDNGSGQVFAHFGQSGVPAWILLDDDGTSTILAGLQDQQKLDDELAKLIGS